MANEYNDSAINEYETYFIGRNDIINRWGNIVSSWSMLPGLVGFWPMSSVQRSTGDAYDISGQGRTLTYSGQVTSTYNIYNNFVPYFDLDGATNYLSRADETDLDILGTETINAAAIRGLTIGAWARFDVVGARQIIASKFNSATNDRSYCLEQYNVTSSPRIIISTDGINSVTAVSSVTISTSVWYFIVGRFTPSTELAIFSNGTKDTNLVGIPASIFNGAASFLVGAINAGVASLMNGQVSLLFLSHQLYSDALINAMFQQSRVLFGV